MYSTDKLNSIELEHFRKYKDFLLYGENPDNMFHDFIGSCGNSICIGFNKKMSTYFKAFLAKKKIYFSLNNNVLKIHDRVSVGMLGLSPKVLVGIDLDEDYYFRNNHSRVEFINYIMEKDQ